METKIGPRNQEVRENEGKYEVFDQFFCKVANDFGFELYWEFQFEKSRVWIEKPGFLCTLLNMPEVRSVVI